MAVHFDYEVDGRRGVALEEIEDAEMRDMVEEVTEELSAELGDVRCPEHGTEPTIVITPTEEGFGATVEGCCEVLAALVEDRIEDIYEVSGDDELQ